MPGSGQGSQSDKRISHVAHRRLVVVFDRNTPSLDAGLHLQALVSFAHRRLVVVPDDETPSLDAGPDVQALTIVLEIRASGLDLRLRLHGLTSSHQGGFAVRDFGSRNEPPSSVT